MDGIYLLENTKSVIIWIGIQAEPKLLTQLFGVDSIQAVNPRMVCSTSHSRLFL
jgi:hypothetical protein